MEEHYLKAARFLCAKMYGKGVRDLAITSHGKTVIIHVEDVLFYLSEKIEAVQKDEEPGEEENT